MIDLEVLNRDICAAHSLIWEAAAEHKAGLIEARAAQSDVELGRLAPENHAGTARVSSSASRGR